MFLSGEEECWITGRGEDYLRAAVTDQTQNGIDPTVGGLDVAAVPDIHNVPDENSTKYAADDPVSK